MYFISFIVITALVMTTLFTGAVSLSMTYAVREIQEAQMKTLRAQAAERAKVCTILHAPPPPTPTPHCY
jgi:hypothetical protein